MGSGDERNTVPHPKTLAVGRSRGFEASRFHMPPHRVGFKALPLRKGNGKEFTIKKWETEDLKILRLHDLWDLVGPVRLCEDPSLRISCFLFKESSDSQISSLSQGWKPYSKRIIWFSTLGWVSFLLS